MKLTKDNINSYIETAKQGDKVYLITSSDIRSYKFISGYQRNKGFYACNSYDETQAILISEYSVEKALYYTDYNMAKEVYYEKAIEHVKSINKIYFDGKKEIIK